MQECHDIFGKIEISAGMWNTYSLFGTLLSVWMSFRFFEEHQKVLLFLGSVGRFFVIFFGLKKKK